MRNAIQVIHARMSMPVYAYEIFIMKPTTSIYDKVI